MKEKINKFLIYLCWFVILVYPFNSTILHNVIHSTVIIVGLIALAIGGLFLFSWGKKIQKTQIKIGLLLMLLWLIVLAKNYYFKEGRESLPILFCLYSFIPLILSYRNKNVEKCFDIVLLIFLIEHVAGSFFIELFENFYESKMISWLANGDDQIKKLLIFWNEKGYNAGLTVHYSTNAIYIAIATIYSFVKWIYNNKFRYIVFCFISFIALLLTAKRAHLLFVVISCFFLYIVGHNSKLRKKFLFTILGLGIIGVLIFVSSLFIPQVLNVIDRFKEGVTNGNLLNGRQPFYDACIEKWKEAPVFGNGWGYFSYYYEENLYNPSSANVLHYLDAHNVYLQLMCETGIFGLVLFVSLFIGILIKSIMLLKNDKNYILLLSIGYQLFFLMYCFSGNPLYDIQCYSIYFILIGLALFHESNAVESVKE